LQTLLEAHVTLFPIALARAEAENALIMAGTKAAMLHDDADGARLLEGQPQACSDLRVRHAEIGTVAVHNVELFESHWIAAPDLNVVREPKDEIAIAGNHVLSDAVFLDGHARLTRYSGCVAALAGFGDRAASLRRMGSASGALVAMGHTRMHSKHCPNMA